MTPDDATSAVWSPTGITGPTTHATYAFDQTRFDAYVDAARRPLTEVTLAEALERPETGLLVDAARGRAAVVSDFAPIEREHVECLRRLKQDGQTVVAVARHARRQTARFGHPLVDDVARRFLLESNRYVDAVTIESAAPSGDAAGALLEAVRSADPTRSWLSDLEARVRARVPAGEAVTVTSGYFNPPQPGTFAMFMEAALRSGGTHIVIANNDMQVWLKKGLSDQMVRSGRQHVMRPAVDRQVIAEANRYISRVVSSVDGDRSVVQTLSRLVEEHAGVVVEFDNGGDRAPDADPIPEAVIETRYPGRARVAYGVGAVVEAALVEAGMPVETSGAYIKSGSSTAFNRALGLERP